MPSRFDHIQYDDEAIKHQEVFKRLMTELGIELESRLHASRPRALALTHLEETYMWIGKAIRDDQIARNGSAPLRSGEPDAT